MCVGQGGSWLRMQRLRLADPAQLLLSRKHVWMSGSGNWECLRWTDFTWRATVLLRAWACKLQHRWASLRRTHMLGHIACVHPHVHAHWRLTCALAWIPTGRSSAAARHQPTCSTAPPRITVATMELPLGASHAQEPPVPEAGVQSWLKANPFWKRNKDPDESSQLTQERWSSAGAVPCKHARAWTQCILRHCEGLSWGWLVGQYLEALLLASP